MSKKKRQPHEPQPKKREDAGANYSDPNPQPEPKRKDAGQLMRESVKAGKRPLELAGFQYPEEPQPPKEWQNPADLTEEEAAQLALADTSLGPSTATAANPIGPLAFLGLNQLGLAGVANRLMSLMTDYASPKELTAPRLWMHATAHILPEIKGDFGGEDRHEQRIEKALEMIEHDIRALCTACQEREIPYRRLESLLTSVHWYLPKIRAARKRELRVKHNLFDPESAAAAAKIIETLQDQLHLENAGEPDHQIDPESAAAAAKIIETLQDQLHLENAGEPDHQITVRKTDLMGALDLKGRAWTTWREKHHKAMVGAKNAKIVELDLSAIPKGDRKRIETHLDMVRKPRAKR